MNTFPFLKLDGDVFSKKNYIIFSILRMGVWYPEIGISTYPNSAAI